MRLMPFLATAMLISGILLSGCDDPGFRGVSGVAEITPAEAAACTLVTNITATPGVYGPLAQQGLEYSRNRVLDLAKESGANAVVFEQVTPGTMVTEVRAAAYRC
jgi:hypothetical protein